MPVIKTTTQNHNRQQKGKKPLNNPKSPTLQDIFFFSDIIQFESMELRQGICNPQSDIHYK